MQVQWWGYHEVVGTLKPNLMQKNLFEIFALTASADSKTSGTILPSHLLELPLTIFVFYFSMYLPSFFFGEDDHTFHWGVEGSLVICVRRSFGGD